MDAATLGELIAAGAAAIGAVAAYLGKRGENAVSGYSHLTGDLQEERDRLDRKVTQLERQLTEQNARYADLAQLRSADQAELSRLRGIIISLGGTP